MKLNLKYSLPVFLFYSFLSLGQSEGDYTISGTHSRYGEFTGIGRIQNGAVERSVRFKNFRYEGKEVEEIWTGKADGELHFKLTLSNLLTAFNGYAPSDDAFQAPMELFVSDKVFQNSASFKIFEDQVEEKWSYAGNSGKGPLWKDLRQTTVALGKDQKLMNFLKKISKLDQVIENFRELPEMSLYRDRPEFQSATQLIVRDKTDADFYLENPDVLRITNKTTNPLSLAEALMRRNAYGNTLSGKEEILREETIKYNFNSAGMLEHALIDEKGNVVGKQTEYDSALWTSMFGWSELLRYQSTKSPDAIRNFRKVLNAILKLTEVTKNENEFARALTESPSDESLGEGWVQGDGDISNLKWRQGGNNDMIKGVFITLVLAHQVINENETELRSHIQKTVKALAKLKAASSRDFNLAMALGLDALWNKDEKKLSLFHSKLTGITNSLGKINHLESGIYFGGIADWSGIHLTMVSDFCQFLLAKELQTVFTEGKFLSKAIEVQKSSEEKLIDVFELYKNAKRDYLTLMVASFIPRFQKDNQEAIKDALWSLKEIPAPRSFGNATADLKKHFHWSPSAWPRTPWKAMSGFRKIKDDFDLLSLEQSAYSYPYFEALAWNCNYIWKHAPFEQKFESNAALKIFSADYLLAYWSARAGGLISPEE